MHDKSTVVLRHEAIPQSEQLRHYHSGGVHCLDSYSCEPRSIHEQQYYTLHQSTAAEAVKYDQLQDITSRTMSSVLVRL